MRTVFTVEVLKGLFLVFFTLLAAHGQLRPIYSIFLQTPAWMNNLAGYISNHLLPSLTLSPPPIPLSSLRVVELGRLSVPFPTPKSEEGAVRLAMKERRSLRVKP